MTLAPPLKQSARQTVTPAFLHEDTEVWRDGGDGRDDDKPRITRLVEQGSELRACDSDCSVPVAFISVFYVSCQRKRNKINSINCADL